MGCTGVRKALASLAMSLATAGALVPVFGVLCAPEAEAATNAAATSAINSIKKQAGSVPGQCGWRSWNPYPSGWTDCKAGCWYFVANVEKKLVGCYPGGTSGYRLTRPGDFSTVGTVTDSPSANPSMSGLQSLMKRAYPGDVIQFKGGPSGWGSYQHTAIVEAVDDGGITIYQHGDSSHVTS
ncbi:MAG: CHAP domain-containing protein, partial [Coriobacteriales bacterium]